MHCVNCGTSSLFTADGEKEKNLFQQPKRVGVGTPPYLPCPGVGEFAFVFAVIDCGTIIDAAAWQPKTGKIATRLGFGGMLGEGQVGRDEIGTTGRPLPVWRDPVGWLKAGRCGVVIAEPDLAAHRLAGIVISGEDHKHGRELRKRLRLPSPMIVSPHGNSNSYLRAVA